MNLTIAHSLISTDCDCCTTPPLYCTCTEAEYFLFSSKLVNVAITLLTSLANMFTIPVTLTQEELRQASTVTVITWLKAPSQNAKSYGAKSVLFGIYS